MTVTLELSPNQAAALAAAIDGYLATSEKLLSLNHPESNSEADTLFIEAMQRRNKVLQGIRKELLT